MFVAIDRNENEITIDEAASRGDYFCKTCFKPVIVKKGQIMVHHFAHARSFKCTDDWNNSGNEGACYDVSKWHHEWQLLYPKDNTEIILSSGDIKHRADVLIDNTVIEFQHSNISSKHFQERTNFYINLGYKVIWLFDFTDEFENNSITKLLDTLFAWSRPKTTFRDVTCTRENVDIFFQIGNDKIIRVVNVTQNGFELFNGSNTFNKLEFLEYTGLTNGVCLPPNTKDAEVQNVKFNEFLKKYSTNLDKPQQRAVQTVNGANLILAVPGSGKTTVLTYRLGYMTICKGIKPENILAITYTNAAEDEMRDRLIEYFHGDIKGKINIKTINSFALEIVRDKTNKKIETAKPEETKKIIRDILKSFDISFYNDVVKAYESAISYIKSKINQELYFKQVIEDKQIDESFKYIYALYNKELENKGLIDFNDQNILALKYLKEDPLLLKKYQNMYKYICVDEAQDTNQIQYELIKLIAGNNPNILMVGDEDQSIYGFNGSYPEALLNFRDEYNNAFILKLERNYRSTIQIVGLSKMFIDKNTKRIKKDMYSYRGKGNDVRIKEVDDYTNQIEYIVNEAKQKHNDMAILYRENDSCIAIAHHFMKNSIPFYFVKKDTDALETSIYRKILGMLELSITPNNYRAFWDVYKNISYYIYPKTIKEAIEVYNKTNKSLIDSLQTVIANKAISGDKTPILSRIEDFKSCISSLNDLDIYKSIFVVCSYLFASCSAQMTLQVQKATRVLNAIADKNDNIQSFLLKIKNLKKYFKEDNGDKKGVALSTFHSSKGLEFNSVYLIDIYDGVSPSKLENENNVLYQEERRLFYVAMTRAKNELCIVKQKNKESSFINELEYYISEADCDNYFDY